jgi:hypothetical protein
MAWDYQAEKATRSCLICGAEPSGIGMNLSLCRDCEIDWLASAERTERATARARFIERRKKENGK